MRKKAPSQYWVRLNVDSCAKGTLGLAGAGGLICDEVGE